MKPYSVLTFVFNNYDILRTPLRTSPNCEYIVITDNPKLKSNIWTVKMLPKHLLNASGFTKSFYVRYHPFEFVNTDVCIVLDGSIQINKPLDKLIHQFNRRKSELCLSINPTQINGYDEFPFWVKHRKYPLTQAHKSYAMMEAIGYNHSTKGCFEATFKICRKTPNVAQFHYIVYSILEYLGTANAVDRLDQPIINAVMNTLFTNINIMPVSRNLYQSSFLSWCQHNSHKAYTTPTPANQKFYLFNKVIKPYFIE